MIRKRLLSFFTAFALMLSFVTMLPDRAWAAAIVPEPYDLWVSGVRVDPYNCNNILGDNEASYDPAGKVLTLKKDITSTADGGVTIDSRIEGLTVKAEKDVTISRPGFGAAVCIYEDTTITGKMTLTGGAGIMAVGCDLTIDSADLDIVGSGWGIYGGLQSDTKLTINNSSIRASGEEGAICGFSEGIMLYGCGILTTDCSVREGCISASYSDQPTPVMAVEITNADIYDLELAGKKVTSDNKDDILGNGEASYDPETKTLTLKKDITCNAENTEGATPCITNRIGGLTVKAEGEITLTRENFGAGIYSEADLTLTGKMNVSGGAGILVTNSTLTIKDAEINATGNAGAIQGGRFGAESGLIIDSSKVNAVCLEEGGAVTGFGKGIELIGCELTDGALVKDGSVYASDGKTAAMSAETEPVTEYGVKIIGIPVTDRNCKDILGNGAVEYDPEKNMLIIRDNIWAGDEPALWCDIPGLTVKTEKALVLYSEAASAAVFSADTTILTNGTLTAESSEKCCILIENGAVLTVKDSDIAAYGLYGIAGSGGNEKLTVNNSYITAEGETWAVGNIGGGITLTDSTIVTPEGGLNSNGSIYNSDGTTRPAKVEITADKFDKYELEVCGVQATSLNCRDILGGGEVSYDAAANTLTVNKDLTSVGPVIDNRIKGLTLKTTKAVTLTSVFLNGIMTSEDMTVITNGKLTLSCNLGGFVLKGDAPTLTIKDSEIAVSGNWGIIGDDESEAVIIENSTVTVDSKSYAIGKLGAALTLKDCYIKTPEGGKIISKDTEISSGYTVFASDEETLAAAVEIVPAEKYDLTVCGVRVTSANKADILSDGVFSYDDTSKTLTVKGNHSINLKESLINNSIDGLTVKIAEDSKLSGCIDTSKSMTVTGPGKLTIDTFSTYQTAVIWGKGNTLTFKDLDASFSGGYTVASRISGENTLKIENSTVYANNSSSFTTPNLDLSAIVLEGCELILPEGGSVSGNVILDARGGLAKEVRIAPPAAVKKGDVNGDGVVDLSDYADLAKYLAEWSGYDKIVNVQAADLNGSGGADLDDLSILAKYLAEWSGYEERYFK